MMYQKFIEREKNRQDKTISLIASENYVSRDVLAALGSVFTNKYAEGYPGKRYYAGNEIVDEVEEWVRSLTLELFGLSKEKWGVNVQPYSGSPANMAIYLALLNPGDKVLSMKLDHGGHLTHGHSVSFSGKLFNFAHYGLDKFGQIDYVELEKKLKKVKPNLVVAGASSYPGQIDFERIGQIAHKYDAIMMSDISHLAGLIATKKIAGCFGFSDVVMSTTHKTLRGPRGAVIMARKELMDRINSAVFPGIQGGPHMNAILGIGVALVEARTQKFRVYQQNVLENALELAEYLKKKGVDLVGGGTANHIVLIDLSKFGIGAKKVEKTLEKIGIICNKNVVPGDKRKPYDPSGLRLGTPAATTRGMGKKEMRILAEIIVNVINNVCEGGKTNYSDETKIIQGLVKKFPLKY